MWYGWTGTGLEVDLSRRKVKKCEGDREIYEKYLGGYAQITKMFWDKVPPGTEPFSPDNMLIFGAGPLVGTIAPSACRACVITLSPLTNWLAHTNMAGFWAPELKFAGYDTLTVSGKSSSPVYIYINNDKVEIRDASHLWGQDTFHTQRLIQEELEDRNVQTMCIGPAGENKVYFADIEHGPGCSMSRGGAGAVMGDKKLKAIAVRGNQDVNVARPDALIELCHDIMKRSAFLNVELDRRWPDPVNGTLYLNTLLPNSGRRFYRNFEFMKPWKEIFQKYLEFLEERKALMVGCFNCQTPCITAVPLSDGEPIYWKCHSRHTFVGAADIQDFNFDLRCFALVQRLGFDSDSAQNLCRFATDLYQKGILTKEDTGGVAFEWGNPETCPAILEKIAYRKDIGDVLANGVYQAACQIGRGTEQYAHHFRKREFSGAARKPSDTEAIVAMLTTDRQGDNVSRFRAFGYDGLLQELKDPDEIERWRKKLESLEGGKDKTGIDSEILGRKLAYDCECGIIRDSAGLCRNRFSKDDNLREFGIAFFPELVSHATGLDLNEEEIRKCARRARALTRAYNAILGEKMRATDLLPQDSQLLPQNLLADNRTLLGQLLADTNRIMGFDPEGIPRKDYLDELGLDYVARELGRRGILPEVAAAPG